MQLMHTADAATYIMDDFSGARDMTWRVRTEFLTLIRDDLNANFVLNADNYHLYR